MRRRLGWLGIAAVLGCGIETKLVGDTLEGGADGAGDSGATPAGDGCDASDCDPQLLWIHERSQNSSLQVAVDGMGHPVWLKAVGLDLKLASYDPETDQELVTGLYGDETDYGTLGVAPDGSIRLLIQPYDGAPTLMRVDAGDTTWMTPIAMESMEGIRTELAVGPDGVSYVVAFGGADYVHVVAIAADGTPSWEWLGPDIDDRFSSAFPGTVGVHAGGLTIFRDFFDNEHADMEELALLTRIGNGAQTSELDLATVLPGIAFTASPVQAGSSWLVPSAIADGGGVLLASVNEQGEVEWLRHDPGTHGDTFAAAVTDDRILVMVDENDLDTDFEVRSYTREGELRGSLAIDLEGMVQDIVSPQLIGPGAFALPDGTVVVQIHSFETSWMIAVQP